MPRRRGRRLVMAGPMCMTPPRKVPLVEDGGGRVPVACAGANAGAAAAVNNQVGDFGFEDFDIEQVSDGGGIALPVGLGARALHGGTATAVEEAELDAGLVGRAAHDAVHGVDFADQMALA